MQREALLLSHKPQGGEGGFLLTKSRIYKKPIAKNALTILINISHDEEVVKALAEDDDEFLEVLLKKITVCEFGAVGERGLSVSCV